MSLSPFSPTWKNVFTLTDGVAGHSLSLSSRLNLSAEAKSNERAIKHSMSLSSISPTWKNVFALTDGTVVQSLSLSLRLNLSAKAKSDD